MRILPVFAGMVPPGWACTFLGWNSPRIRGDGPDTDLGKTWLFRFSPYSRGWSYPPLKGEFEGVILPVFAGMVPARPLGKPN